MLCHRLPKLFTLAGMLLCATPSLHAGTRLLNPSDDLQTAVDQATSGDVILLPTTYHWKGHLKLHNHPGNGFITFMTADFPALPAGTRVKPANSTHMPSLSSPDSDPAISNEYDSAVHSNRPAHHYRFIGVEVTTTSSFNWNLVLFDPGDQPTAADIPHDIEFQRCYIHAGDQGDAVRGILANVSNFTAQDSYFSGFKSTFMEANAIAMYTSPGPYHILNNYLEAAGENMIFCGVVETIAGMIPANIEIRHNYFFKPLSWRNAGYIVKNLLEFKNGLNITIDQNIFENIWQANQSGAAVLLVPRTGNGAMPMNTIQNVTFTNNIIRHAGKGFSISAYDDLSGLPTSSLVKTKDFLFQNNLLDDISGITWGDRGVGFQFSGPPDSLVINRNTIHISEVLNGSNAAANGGWWIAGDTTPSNMVVTNNMFGWQLFEDGRIGPDSVPKGTKFQKNTILNVESFRQPAWLQQYPDTKFVEDGTTGADEKTLLANESSIKNGTTSLVGVIGGTLF